MNSLVRNHVTCVFCVVVAKPVKRRRVVAQISAERSAVQCSIVKSPEEFLVEFQGSREIEEEMARRLHSDLRR
jgi:hypothetical protein